MWKLRSIAETRNKIKKRNETAPWKREATGKHFNKPKYSKNRLMHQKYAWNELQNSEWIFERKWKSQPNVYRKTNSGYKSNDARYLE